MNPHSKKESSQNHSVLNSLIMSLQLEIMAGSKECVVTKEMVTVLRLSRIFGTAPIYIKPIQVSITNNTGTVNCCRISASKTYGIISSIFIFLIRK